MKNTRTPERQIHISWHIAWMAGGIVCGIALAGIMHITYIGMGAVAAAVILLSVTLLRRWRRIVPLALAAGLLIGVWRGSIEQQALLVYPAMYGQPVTVRGSVSDDAAYGASGDQRFQLTGVAINGKHLHGKVWVSIQRPRDIKRSDTVTAAGTLAGGFGNIPATLKRAQVISVERPQPGDIALRIRDWFSDGIRKAIPEPQAALGIGYLVGQHAAMPQTLTDQIKVAGLTHAVVASGYNLTILVSFARKSLLKASKYLATLAGSLMIVSFVLVTGLSPSMTRAGLVTGLSLLAWYYGRKMNPLVLLPVAAAITTMLNPAYVWGDIGWFLSFTSFAGVLIIAPLFHSYFWGRNEAPTFRQILIETTSAQLATMPVILFAFGQFATYALLANMLVLPLIPLAMVLTFGAGIVGLALPHFAHIAGWPAHMLLQYMTGVIAWVSKLPNASAIFYITAPALVAGYIAIALCCVHMVRRTRYSFKQASMVTIGEKL